MAGDSDVPQVNVHAPEGESSPMPHPARVETWPRRPPPPSQAARLTALVIPRARNDYWLSGATHYYEVIGECYVHGMMDGEAFAAKNARKIGQQIFELR
jgi:hypothetical protein